MQYYTYAEYMLDNEIDAIAAHRKYFGQFVTQRTIDRVLSVIGHDQLIKSTDRHMNDINLSLWDSIVSYLPGSGGFKKVGDYYTNSHGVCLAKEAARQYLESLGIAKQQKD
jgi:hypothetical protein